MRPSHKAIEGNDLVVAAVLSGNRNFEGRIHPLVRASYLASPPLVVAFALAGTVDIDLSTQPLGTDRDGAPVFLADLWPTTEEVKATVGSAVSGDLFREAYASVFDGDARWRALDIPAGDRYRWEDDSTYVCPAAVLHRTPAGARTDRPDRRGSRPGRSWAIRSPPTTSPRPVPSRPGPPPASGSRSTACRRWSSTRTGPGAATTKS